PRDPPSYPTRRSSDLVRMNARVAFRIDGRRDVQVRTLVYPEEYAQRADRDECISVLTPLGAALLGLKAGTGMAYMAPGGTEHHRSEEHTSELQSRENL